METERGLLTGDRNNALPLLLLLLMLFMMFMSDFCRRVDSGVDEVFALADDDAIGAEAATGAEADEVETANNDDVDGTDAADGVGGSASNFS